MHNIRFVCLSSNEFPDSLKIVPGSEFLCILFDKIAIFFIYLRFVVQQKCFIIDMALGGGLITIDMIYYYFFFVSILTILATISETTFFFNQSVF